MSSITTDLVLSLVLKTTVELGPSHTYRMGSIHTCYFIPEMLRLSLYWY